MAVVLPCAGARGERSYSLPEIDAAAALAAPIVRSAVWARDAEASTDNRDITAIGAGTIAFARHGQLCGYAEVDGAQTWCARGGTAPVYASGQVAFTAADGAITSVDAATGSLRWRHRFPIPAKSIAGVDPNIEAVWSTGTDFLVVRESDDTVGELSASGATRWVAHGASNSLPLIEKSFAFFPSIESGAIVSTAQHLVRLGSDGGAGDIAFESPQIAAVDPPYAFVALDPPEEVEDHLLTFDIGRVDLRTGNTDPQYHVEPDYDANAATYYKFGGFAYTSASPVRYDGAMFYLTVADTLYRYRFADPSRQRPLLVSHDAGLIGGPYHGAVFARRHDGVWSLRPGSGAIHARLLAPSAAAVSAFALAGSSAYVAFDDGSVQGVNADTGEALLLAKPCAADDRIRLATSRTRIYVACLATNRSHIVAFPRADPRRSLRVITPGRNG